MMDNGGIYYIPLTVGEVQSSDFIVRCSAIVWVVGG
jgi:hypothetical protein